MVHDQLLDLLAVPIRRRRCVVFGALGLALWSGATRLEEARDWRC